MGFYSASMGYFHGIYPLVNIEKAVDENGPLSPLIYTCS
jgi:hypothetical protein